jgi:transposase
LPADYRKRGIFYTDEYFIYRQVLPATRHRPRWVVERTFAWITRCRRLSMDYEVLPASSEAWIYIAMIRVMMRRLAPE